MLNFNFLTQICFIFLYLSLGAAVYFLSSQLVSSKRIKSKREVLLLSSILLYRTTNSKHSKDLSFQLIFLSAVQTSWVIALWRICITCVWPSGSQKLPAPSSQSERHLHFASIRLCLALLFTYYLNEVSTHHKKSKSFTSE